MEKVIDIQEEEKNDEIFKQPVPEVTEKTKLILLLIFSIGMMGLGFVFNSPMEIWEGMKIITFFPGRLLTDYMAVASSGAAFFNAGLVTTLSILMIYSQKVKISGPMIAGIFTIFGFALFGKNLFNTIPITLGVYLYSKLERRPFSHFMLASLFGTALGPAVSELAFGMGLPIFQGVLLGYGVGILIGLILPPVSAHFLSFHQGFSLYNVGFTAGIIGMFVMAMINFFDRDLYSVSILYEGNNVVWASILFGLCILFIGVGFYYNGKSMKGYRDIWKHSGKLISDFVLLEGFGKSVINMGLLGIISTAYVLLVGGDLNGPTIGGIFTIIGFGAFGKHPANSIPILIGVYVASLLNVYDTQSTPMLLAVLFGTTLAPISGYYGALFGAVAGFVHMALVVNIGVLHGGMNLYNNGFSGGFVAAVLVPIFDAILKIKRGKK